MHFCVPLNMYDARVTCLRVRSGDREKALGVAVSSVCDRQINSVADIQIGQTITSVFTFHRLSPARECTQQL